MFLSVEALAQQRVMSSLAFHAYEMPLPAKVHGSVKNSTKLLLYQLMEEE